MSFISPKEFAEFVEVKYATIRGHISRGKIVKKDGYIDTEHPTNKLYIEENKKQKPLIEKEKIPNPTKVEHVEVPNEIVKKNKQKDYTNEGESTGISLRKKRADALKSEKEAELKELQIQKLMGKLMPIEMVEKIVVINIQSILREMESEFENISSVYCEILGGDRSHFSEMNTRMREALHKIVQNSKKRSSEEIELVINDYSVSRNRGEKN